MNENLKTSLADWRNRWANLHPLTFGHAQWVKGARSAGAALLLGGFALSLGGCAGYYEPGYAGAYYNPDYSPIYSDYGYNDGAFGGCFGRASRVPLPLSFIEGLARPTRRAP